MSKTHHCQKCKRAVILTDDGIIRACPNGDGAACREPVAAIMTATAYGLARIAEMSDAERAEKRL
jgi:hypothetical protein